MHMIIAFSLCVLLIFGLIGEPCAAKASKKKSCYSECKKEDSMCNKAKEKSTKECYFEYAQVCLRKCNGLKVTNTFDQYDCNGKCFDTTCWSFEDEKEEQKCKFNEYDCQRTCMGMDSVTAERYNSAYNVCHNEKLKCRQSREGDCKGIFWDCMDEKSKG